MTVIFFCQEQFPSASHKGHNQTYQEIFEYMVDRTIACTVSIYICNVQAEAVSFTGNLGTYFKLTEYRFMPFENTLHFSYDQEARE